MGRLAVRTAIAKALTTANFTYVGTVYPARPIIATESAYYETMSGQAIQLSANGSSAVLVVNLPGPDKRLRRTLVGRPNVNDTDVHPVAVEIFFASQPSSDLTTPAGIAAQQDYDAIVDALTVYVRTHPVMGTPTVVWSAGEYAAGVTHVQEQPYTAEDGQTVLINGVVRFEAWEWIAGTNV